MIVIYQMKVYWQLILVLLFLPDVRSWTNVTDCPYSEDEWRNRSMSYDCHSSGGFKYHCLKTTTGHLVEKCHTRLGLNEKDGCPIFAFRNSSYRITQTSCTGPPQGCPRRNKTFLSYEIYKFPSCLPPRFDRSMSVALDTYTSIQYYRETTVDPELTTQLDATKPTSHVQHETTNKDFPLTVTKQKSEVSFIGENLLYIAVGGTVVFIIIVGFICLVLVQCKRIKQFKFQMERANYMSSVPYNSHATHIYHQDTDIYDYVDETDMKDDDENTVQSDKLRQNIEVYDESDANVEPNRPDRESKERNEILHMYIPMRNAPMNCSSNNSILHDTYLEPNVGVLAARLKNDNVEVSESNGNTPSQNGRVCIKLTRLVSNDSYVEPCIGQHQSSNKDLRDDDYIDPI